MIASSLLVRLMAAFAFVILLGIAIIYLITNQATTNEFRGYMFRGQMAALDEIASDLANYYTGRGNWAGVDQFLAQGLSFPGSMMGNAGHGPMGRGMMVGAQLFLADTNGIVIASRDRAGLGQRLPPAQIAKGTPIVVNSRTVGTLVDPTVNSTVSTALDSQEQDFVQRLNLSILLAGGVAGLVALVLGFVLFYQMTAPLNALAAASRKIAAGDLNARVTRPRNDEIGQVGQAFNAMAESLAQSEAARQNMIADIAHELRNPLGVMQGQLEGMLDGVFPLTAEQIASLHDETLLLNRLVADLRDLALADAGQLRIAHEPAEIKALVEKTVAAFSLQAAEKNIALETEIAPALPVLKIDAQRIEQVLRNLIGNALRHTPQGGTVHVRCGMNLTPPPTVVVRVGDNGPGIPPADLPHVFERFWRGDKSRSRAGGSAGLGLAIAKQLVAAHGGTIGVESPPGQGAEFWFTLPVITKDHSQDAALHT